MTENHSNANAYLATEPISKLLPKFAVPCVMSMLVSALYNIVDQVFIGQSVGYLGNAATNVVYPFTVVALALALLVGDGAAALLSLSLGSGDAETGHKSVGNGMVLTLIVAVVLTVVGLCFTDPLLRLFGVTEGCYPYAWDYMRIIVLGIPFYVFTSSLNGCIRADGAPAYAMVSTAVGAVINLILDPVAIFIFDMGVKGAAWATIIGQIVTCILALLYFRKPKAFRFHPSSFRLSGSIIRRILLIGLPSLIIQVAIVIIMSVANRLIGSYGPQSVYGADIPLSVVGIVMKVFAIVISFAVGIALGGQPILGYNYGAGNYKRVFETFRFVTVANLVVGVVAMALFELCPQVIVRLFGSESALYNEYAYLCFRVFLGGIILTCFQKGTSIFLQAIGKSVQSTILSLSRDVVFFVPAIVALASWGGVTGMLWAAPVADVLSALLSAALVAMEYRKVRSHLKQDEEAPFRLGQNEEKQPS